MRYYHIVLATTVLLCAACSSGTAPASVANVQGAWELDTQGGLVPGISFFLSLDESAGVVSGSGTFTGEAAPFGTLVAHGTAAGDSLHLRILYIFDPTTFPQLKPDTAQFDGALVDANHIQGQLDFVGQGTTETLKLMRVPIAVGTARAAMR